MADIFLSYAREDEMKARRLAVVLESRGWSVWWDRRIPHGQDFTTHIQQQLDEARCIVVLWTKNAVRSQFVRDEAAEGLNGRLVPLLLEAVKQPLGFRQVQAADLSDWDPETPHTAVTGDDELSRVIESIAAIIASHPLAGKATTLPPGPVSRTGTLESKRPPDPGRVPPHKVDVYISCADLDDGRLDGQIGWVTSFNRALGVRIGQMLGREPNIWMNLKTGDADRLRDGLAETLEATAIFVAVVSPRWVSSPRSHQELAAFERACSRQGGFVVHGKSRLFKVIQTPVPDEQLPQILQSTLGYELFKVDPDSGRARDLALLFDPVAEQEFFIRLDDLAHDIARLLQEYRP